MEFWTAISIGLLGSLHCVGMCGPIALALPLNRENDFTILTGSVIYNLGRLITYFLLGVLFGLMGQGIALAGFQQGLSITVGLLMILSVLWPFLQIRKINFPVFNLWIGKLKASLGKRLGRKSPLNLFLIGTLNGLLPCGLVYLGIAGSFAMATPLYGGLFMLFFGLGTIPLMLAIGVYGQQIKRKMIQSFRRWIPIMVALIGVLFIVRGLNLGVPYLSPKLDSKAQIIKCD